MSKLQRIAPGIYKRGPHQFQVKIRRNGAKVSRTFETLKAAQSWRAVQVGKIVADDYVDRRKEKRTKLHDVLERYLNDVTPNKKGSRQEGQPLAHVEAYRGFESHLVRHLRPLARRPMLALAAFLLVAAPDTRPAKNCVTVSGAYAIYANNDFLRIDHSRHLIEVVSDALDKELDKHGWQDVAARGRFTLCSQHATNPLNWTVSDQVDLIAFKDIHYVGRRAN